MSWEDRLQTAVYTTPSGIPFIFDYENVSEISIKNTIAYTYPDADGTFVQDLGKQGRKYPLRCIFFGEDYDLQATAFVNGLTEKGIGKLQHPIYGTIDVVPFGSITRKDDLKTASNQAIITVTFFETNMFIFPTSQDDPESDVLNSLEDYKTAAAEQFETSTSFETTTERALAVGNYQINTDAVTATLKPIAETDNDVLSRFDAIVTSINNSLTTLLGEPLTIASQTVLMIQAPALALVAIQKRLDAYQTLLNNITLQALAVVGLDSENSNNFHVDDLFGSSYVTGSILSVVNNTFEIKSDALSAAETILDQMDTLTVWRDDNYESLKEIDTGEAYQQLIEAVSVAAGFLVEISFSLKQEKRFFLVRNRNFIELTFELYGNTDDSTLNFFIDTNALTGSEILELPIGREIVYYV